MPSAPELRELDDLELEDRLGEYRKELLNLRFQLATGQLDNAARVGQVRRDVARVLTILRDREIALAEGREPTVGRAPVVRDEPAAEPKRRARKSRKAADEDEFETEDEVLAAEEDGADDAEFEAEAGSDDDGDDGEEA